MVSIEQHEWLASSGSMLWWWLHALSHQAISFLTQCCISVKPKLVPLQELFLSCAVQISYCICSMNSDTMTAHLQALLPGTRGFSQAGECALEAGVELNLDIGAVERTHVGIAVSIAASLYQGPIQDVGVWVRRQLILHLQ